MKPAVPEEELPTVEETMAVLCRHGEGKLSRINWAAVTAGFVCPGAGQFMAGKKAAGVFFLSIFLLGCGVSLIPLFVALASSVRMVFGDGTPAMPIPWLFVGGGFGIAILTWLAAMLQAAFLTNKTDPEH